MPILIIFKAPTAMYSVQVVRTEVPPVLVSKASKATYTCEGFVKPDANEYSTAR